MYIRNNKVYDALRWAAQFFLPASAALYFTLSSIWNLPYATEVVGTITALHVFVGAILGLSAMQYSSEQVRTTGQSYNASPTDRYMEDFPNPDPEPFSLFELKPELYDLLKWTVLTVSPALGTLYLVLAGLWGFPYGEQFVATLAACTAFLGVFLGLNSYKFRRS